MRRVALTLVLAAGLLRPGAAQASAGPDLPSILVIYADDLGYGDVAAFGGEPNCVKEPHNVLQCDQDTGHDSDWCECAP